MNGNYQPTSAPYNADNLKPHDAQLVWMREFGTETTENTGEAFSGNPLVATVNKIDARTGYLEVKQNSEDADDTSVNGTTFLLPKWSDYPPTPIFGTGPDDPRVICLYAHLLLAEGDNFDGPASAQLILAPEDFVGNVGAIGCAGIGPVMDNQPQEDSVAITGWNAGAGQIPTNAVQVPLWGSNIYLRLLIAGDDFKESELTAHISRDGLSWTALADLQVPGNGNPMRRVGMGMIGGQGFGWLDWVRVYSFPLTGVNAGLTIPPFPLTGDRRY